MKNKKATKKFAASGKLKQTIQARHKQQKLKKQIEGRRQRKGVKEQTGKAGVKGIAAEDVDMDDDDGEEKLSILPKVSSKGKGKVKPETEVNIKKYFLDGEDDEVRHAMILRIHALNEF
jgi:nucleolar complex protein 2